jgi:hypothetical protein
MYSRDSQTAVNAALGGYLHTVSLKIKAEHRREDARHDPSPLRLARDEVIGCFSPRRAKHSRTFTLPAFR